MSFFRQVGVALLLLMLTMPSYSEGLTARDIDRWIEVAKTFKKFEAAGQWDDEDEDEVDILSGNFSIEALQAKMLKEIKGSPEVMTVLRKQGFTAERWAEVGQRITKAYGALEMEADGVTGAEMRQELAKALEEIEKNPYFNEAQKAQMRAQMGAAQGMMEQFTQDVSPQDKAIVKAKKNLLDAVFQDND